MQPSNPSMILEVVCHNSVKTMMNPAFLTDAFKLWQRLIDVNSSFDSRRDTPRKFQETFQKIALDADISETLRIGQEQGFSEHSVIGMIILHGGYFRLVNETNLKSEQMRHIDSLYGHSFPSVDYYSRKNVFWSLVDSWRSRSSP